MDTERLTEQAAVAGRDPRWRRRMTVLRSIEIVSIVVLALCLAWFIVKQSSAANVAQQLSGQIRALGATPVAAAPAPVVGQAGQPGTAGRDGVSITGTRISDGHLVVSYSDGHTQDVGQVVGVNGTAGKDGRGIKSTAVTGGHLLVSYTDGSTTDLGAVSGPKGATGTGVASVTVSSDFRLIVAYSDGSTSDAGALPPGPAGAKGDPGENGTNGQPPAGWTATFSDGSTETCSRADGFDATNPQYTCTVSPPPTTQSPTTTTTPLLPIGG